MNMELKSRYLDPAWSDTLQAAGLDNMDAWLALDKEQVDNPNHRWGGISVVFRRDISAPDGRQQRVYIKHQKNMFRRARSNPLRRELTYLAEFRNLMRCRQLGFEVPKPLFFAIRGKGRDQECVMVTENLQDFVPVKALTSDDVSGVSARRKLLRDVAHELARFHQAGLTHQSLYDRHVMVRWNDAAQRWDVAFIDMEKCRSTRLSGGMYRDLESLSRRSAGWRFAERLYFLREYIGARSLAEDGRKWIAGIRRAARKKWPQHLVRGR